MREILFALALLVAGSCVVVGVALLFAPVAWIVAGVLVAGWSYLVLADDGSGRPVDVEASE